MSIAYLHLIINHVPIVGSATLALFLAWGLLRRSRDVIRVSLGATLLVAAATYPVYLSGEGAAEELDRAAPAWFDDHLAEAHEERAEAALVALLATGAIAGIALWRTRRERAVSRPLAGAVLAGLAVSLVLAGWTARAGGVIRHDEVRPGAPRPSERERERGLLDARVREQESRLLRVPAPGATIRQRGARLAA